MTGVQTCALPISNDGTSEYLDELQREYPDNITVYRKPAGEFWEGKLEMVNAPLQNIREQCLLWEIDVDELWTAEQITRCRELFFSRPEKSAACFYCHFLVGQELVITTRDTYGNNTSYEWLRVWRFEPGMKWRSHEPPQLCRNVEGEWRNLAGGDVFTHSETEGQGLIFQHHA